MQEEPSREGRFPQDGGIQAASYWWSFSLLAYLDEGRGQSARERPGIALKRSAPRYSFSYRFQLRAESPTLLPPSAVRTSRLILFGALFAVSLMNVTFHFFFYPKGWGSRSAALINRWAPLVYMSVCFPEYREGAM